jgi:beta-phosphoglucomutase-like phosphatase (HAD superfamily)
VPAATSRLLGLPSDVRACIFDLDSVLTTSASIHAAAWADTFDSLLLARAARQHEPFIPFDRVDDYRQFVAERPRVDGVRAFLSSRRLRLPEGTPEDPPQTETVHGLANRKGAALERHLAREGVAAYIGSRCYLEAAFLVGIRCAVVSASANTTEILERAALTHLVNERIDAAAIKRDGLASKPAPDTLTAACRLLDVEPAKTADFETTPAGVKAARAAGLQLVVAVEREGQHDKLRTSGPDLIVNDLAQLLDQRYLA